MGIVCDFEKHKYILPTEGEGIADTVKSVADFVMQNKAVLKNAGKAIGIADTVKSLTDFVSQNKDTLMDVGKAVGNISEAIKAAK